MKEYWNKLTTWWQADKQGSISLWLLLTAVAALVMLAIFVPLCSEAATLDLTCTPPTERTDGTSLAPTEIQGYEWFRNGALVGTSGDCTYTMNAPDGTYAITAKTVDTGGRKSAMSPSVDKTFTTAAPLPPVLQ